MATATLVLIAVGAGFALHALVGSSAASDQTDLGGNFVRPFDETGVITGAYLSGNDGLLMTYDEPGAPARVAVLRLTEQSICRFEGKDAPCMAISAPLAMTLRGRMVAVKGHWASATVYIDQLTADSGERRAFGFIRQVERNGQNALISIDEAQWLTGDDARAAAKAAGGCADGPLDDCYPSLLNGYYVQNEATSTVPYVATPDTAFLTFKEPGGAETATTTLDAFIMDASDPKARVIGGPAWFTLSGATLTRIELQYVP